MSLCKIQKLIRAGAMLILLNTIVWVSSCISKHERLISFSSQYSHDFSEKELDDPEQYPMEKIISQQQVRDTLILEVDLPFSGCADLEGNIHIKNDSLILFYYLTDETLCTEQIHYLLTYKIMNQERMKYKPALQYKKRYKNY
ncbi:hypothetical protein GXP67_32320 [Rhodocytophaga rosea]|uniref:Lipoprotein n=1 Tax=Rhodocytophaga rosea TaxID=2704465 RepID=A0A6C0GT64_9BACT|nr:hypothetical protein [Rhodocytophaga rosea]QHT71004.1 hypothetical protein GXP67_32320 [Rhodocytophaga rosea]